MNSSDFFNTKIEKAKGFGFPEPIFINTEKLTSKNRVIYMVEIQAVHVGDSKNGGTHHFYLKFSKFNKIKEEPFWIEEDLVNGFVIKDKSSIEKLAAYIKANQALLNIDILSKDFTSIILSDDEASISVLKQILAKEKNRSVIFELFKEKYPNLDKKILVYKLVEERKKALEEFKESLEDSEKKERNFWQPFLKKNRWMFGLAFIVPMEDSRIDQWDVSDYLFQSTDGFLDIVEIKHPFVEFWQKDHHGMYIKYRNNFIQPSEENKGAITQAINYIFQLEKKFNDPDWQRRNGCDAPVKPNCTVILGRSNAWGIDERTAYRLLNDSLHGIEVITFDYLLDRANRLVKILEDTET